MTTTDAEPTMVSEAVAARGGRPDDDTVVSLLLRCATGDMAALADLYDETSSHVYQVSLLVLGDETAAAAATVRTYRTVWEQSSRYSAIREGSALSWLVTVAYAHARAA